MGLRYFTLLAVLVLSLSSFSKASPQQFTTFQEINNLTDLPQNLRYVFETVPSSGVLRLPVGVKVYYSSAPDTAEQEWSDFKIKFRKVYSSAQEETYRRSTFMTTRDQVSQWNLNYDRNKQATYVLKISYYADYTIQDLNTYVYGFTYAPPAGSYYVPAANVVYPGSVDWREVGAVTSVKSQDDCGNCYALSAVGAIEGQLYRKTGILTEISAQNVMDCSNPQGNHMCNTGHFEKAFDYVKSNRGISKEVFYPLENKNNTCRYREKGYATHVTGYHSIKQFDETHLEAVVSTMGPVSAAIDANHESFKSYSSGIYFEPNCASGNTTKLNHALLVVGYGTEQTGEQYWLLKNSFGSSWGIAGYMKLARNKNNHCGIASMASVPLLQHL